MASLRQYGFGIKHYWIYFKENFKIGFKETIEFKANLINLLLIEIFLMFSYFLFLKVILNNFNQILDWDVFDIILLYFSISLIQDISGLFWYNKLLSQNIIGGSFNTFLSKPGNPFFNFFFSKSFNVFFVNVLYLLIIFGTIFYLDIDFLRIFFFILIVFLLIILYAFFFHFLTSFSFYFLGVGDFLLMLFFENTNSFFKEYPYQFFKNFSFKFLLFIFPIIFVSSLLIPLLRGYDFMLNPYLQVGIIVFLIIIFGLGIWLNWHYGLKKYEAFG